MKIKASITALLVMPVLLLQGCMAARSVHEFLPTAKYVNSKAPSTNEVYVYANGEQPQRPLICYAKIGSHGNGYANNSTLINSMKDEAKKIGADAVVVTSSEITKDETIATYGNGIAMSDQIKRPHLYGVACKYSKVKFGTKTSKDGTVEYVSENSTAEKIGIQEGMKILAINGKPVKDNDLILQTEISTKEPGESIVVEFLDKQGNKIRKNAILEAM